MANKAAAFLLGTTSATTTPATMAWVAEAFPPLEYNSLAVLIGMTALTGSTATATYSFQEEFGAAGFVETANSGSLSATGNYWFVNGTVTGTSPSTIRAQSPMLGTGGRKQMVITLVGTAAGTFNASVYMIPLNI